MTSILSIVIELTVGLFALLLLTKFVGKASLAESTPFDFISMIVVGDFVSDAIYDPETHVFKVLFTLALWGFLIALIDWITLRFHRTRTFFESRPEIVIDNGQINRRVLKKSKVDINHLQMMLRDRNVFSIREVAYAILEPNGKVSVIKNPEFDQVLRLDLNLPARRVTIPITLISDGTVIERNLTEIGKDRDWLMRELARQGIGRADRVMIAEWRQEDGLYVQTLSRNDH